MAKFTHNTDWIYKYVNETFGVQFNFTNDLDTSEKLSSVTATITDEDGNDTTSAMISNTNVASANIGRITFTIAGGTAAKSYEIKIAGVSDSNNKFVRYITCDVYNTITLNSKLGDPNANSYVTISEINEYAKNKYGHNNTWDTLSIEGKKRILVESANELERYSYKGAKYYDSQALEFPRDNHSIITGACATPITINSFKNTSLKSTTYGQYPTNYWKHGSCHITLATPLYDIREINLSHVTTGSVTTTTDFSSTPTTNTKFIVFTPLHKKIKDAQCEQVMYIINNANIESIQNYKNIGVRRLEIGDIRIDMEKGSTSKVSISPVSRKLLSQWIRKSLRVQRS